MKIGFLGALAAAMCASSALGCPIAELKKVADDHLDRLPASAEHEPEGNAEAPDGGGGAWQMFQGENGKPHSIVFTYLGESGQMKVRMSFLNRRDFVAVETEIDYEQPVFGPDATGRFKIKPLQYYFFCDGQLQLPAGTPDAAKIEERASYWKKRITESTGLLKQEFERIPN